MNRLFELLTEFLKSDLLKGIAAFILYSLGKRDGQKNMESLAEIEDLAESNAARERQIKIKERYVQVKSKIPDSWDDAGSVGLRKANKGSVQQTNKASMR